MSSLRPRTMHAWNPKAEGLEVPQDSREPGHPLRKLADVPDILLEGRPYLDHLSRMKLQAVNKATYVKEAEDLILVDEQVASHVTPIVGEAGLVTGMTRKEITETDMKHHQVWRVLVPWKGFYWTRKNP
ncbi:MAG: hypothetical protein Q9184_002603 [Pyrenodesmia sp. 2 TL-2023]